MRSAGVTEAIGVLRAVMPARRPATRGVTSTPSRAPKGALHFRSAPERVASRHSAQRASRATGGLRPIASDLDRRVIGLTLEQMRAIPTRLIIAGGPEKTEVIRTAVTSGIATALVTDNEVAQALLDGV